MPPSSLLLRSGLPLSKGKAGATSVEEMTAPRVAILKGPIERSEFRTFLRKIISDNDVNERDIDTVFDRFDKDADNVLSELETDSVNRFLISAINDLRTAIIVVDFQNDFVSGSLAIGKGGAKQNPTEALAPLNRLLTTAPSFDTIIYTLDWHPSNHISFYEHCRNSDRTLALSDRQRKLKPFDTVTFETPVLTQRLYPRHCVQKSWGAELSANLIIAEDAKYIHKGFEVYVDSYSAFYNNNKTQRSDLEQMLRSENINAVFVCGLAHDICVAATAHDALDLGFLTAVVEDCSKGLDISDIENANKTLSYKQCAIIDSDVVQAFLKSHKVPWPWVAKMCGVKSGSSNGITINH
ncbi:hypothetical protein QR680_019422 [Steinernema hermaphroditum]|uniref:nicotinamidase n=1 Tax=Steinernema hermaphroditum TaxID=289476 RepID=A0AA39GMN2_9BILA|nr:hypothetical protein QR680_019439 [Steinernema hermaphroditum]KAK0390196.1 hypothetical protein QR680_019426 [Steinernema hermaphroditum]KAK0390213.1 hypothetical protein QR680_019422 [Steinernema hermaphroditum]